tara:strand:+ start:3982 stop:4335 length:354 start_codon:yes stop_codon:yes gene_type:complete
MHEDQSEPAPVLFSSNLRRTFEFYERELGFLVESTEKSLWITYLDLKLKVISTDDTDLVAGIGVVFKIKNIGNLYRRLLRRSMPNLGKLCHTSLGGLHFSLKDPDGNSLYFREHPRR